MLGCTPPPSFELSWRLADDETDDAGAEPSSAGDCSMVGLSKVRVTTLPAGENLCSEIIVDERSYPCFPGGGLPVAGPTLEPGAYTLVVQGLRRSGEPWPCQADDPVLGCKPEDDAPTCYARAVVDVEVGPEGTIVGDDLVSATLLEPLPCDDGIDNDGDGRVDGRDPGCFARVSGDGTTLPIELRREDDEEGVTLFQTAVSLLDAEVIEPRNLGIDSFELGFRVAPGDPITAIARVDESTLDYSNYPFALPIVDDSDAPLEPGTYEITMTALDAAGEPLSAAIEGFTDASVDPPIVETLTIDEGQSGYYFGEFVFEAGDFLEPIVQPFAFSPDLVLNASDAALNACTLGGEDQTLDQLWIHVRDEGGQTLDAATLGLMGSADGAALMPVDEAGGWVSFACPSSLVRSEDLDWGSYEIEVQGRIGAEVCFETAEGPTDLAPQIGGNAQIIELTRVFEGEAAACPECMQDADCDGSKVCDTQTLLCVNKDPTRG